jgi:hypothetical protein
MPPIFAPQNTRDIERDEPTKTLCLAHHGFGKTTQCAHYQDYFGKGFILSGEAGLKSIANRNIDYLHFNSWEKYDANGELSMESFRGIVKAMNTEEFKQQDYKWIAIDSLTELSDLCYRHFNRLMDEEIRRDPSKKRDGFAVWGNYNSAIVGALKWVRDLDYHVLMTSLANETTDDNGMVEYLPAVQGNKIARLLPGMFDNVLCGMRTTENDPATGRPRIQRKFVTDEVHGWRGKVRDPYGRIEIVEETSNICDILKKINTPPEEE